nr:regulator of chromosome condensation-like [Onthophagus taurus]
MPKANNVPNKRRAKDDPVVSRRLKKGKFTLNDVPIVKENKEGVVLVTGAGDVGQLGLGSDVLEKTRFGLVKIDDEIIDVYAGGMHTVCLTKDGKVITFGCNDEGALGRPTDKADSEFEPGVVDLPGKVKQITAGDSHTAALLEDGKVYAWGTFRDSHGSMGLTPTGNEKLPYLIMSEHVIIKIASGSDHIVFLTNHGEVFTCGCAEQGQLGRLPERSSGRNARSGIGKDQIAKLLVPHIINLKPHLKLHFEDIWAGHYATFAKVADKNDVYSFGLNNYHQIGAQPNVQYNPTKSEVFSKYKWLSICCGQHHTIALDVDGQVYTIGRKEYGRLGLGENCEESIELVKIPSIKDKVICIGTGSATSFAVTEKGDLYGWGMGNNGQLGTGKEDDSFAPILIEGKQLVDKKVYRVNGGGQHTVILALSNINNNKTE